MKLQLRLPFSSSKMQTFNAFDLRHRLSCHILCCVNIIHRNLSSTTQPIPKSVSRKFSSIKMNDNKSVIITAVLIGLVICIGTGVVFLTPPSDLECPIDGLTTLNGIVMEDIVPMTRFTVLEPKMAEYYDWTGRKVTTFTGMREARPQMGNYYLFCCDVFDCFFPAAVVLYCCAPLILLYV